MRGSCLNMFWVGVWLMGVEHAIYDDGVTNQLRWLISCSFVIVFFIKGMLSIIKLPLDQIVAAMGLIMQEA